MNSVEYKQRLCERCRRPPPDMAGSMSLKREGECECYDTNPVELWLRIDKLSALVTSLQYDSDDLCRACRRYRSEKCVNNCEIYEVLDTGSAALLVFP